MSPTRIHLPGLDALRGVAAVAVVLLHGSYAFDTGTVVSRGYLAVDFFFMLSGFVLTHAYADRLRNGLEAGAVIRARIRRLYPMLLLGIGAGIAASAFADMPGERIAAASITAAMLVPTLTGDALADIFPIDPPLWSLFWEMIASVFLARVLWRLPSRWLRLVQAVSLVALACAASRNGTTELGFQTGTFASGAARIGFGFVTGMVLHRWWARRSPPTDGVSIVWPAGAFVLAICLPAPAPRALCDLAVTAIVFPAVIVVAAGVRHVARPWHIGALMSYPLYLVHAPILRAVLRWRRDHPGLDPDHCIAIGLALSLIAAWLACRFWDAPVQAWLKDRATTREAVPVTI